MSAPRDEPWTDAWIEYLVQYDETLRLGRDPAPSQPADAGLEEAQQFLLRLQAVWPRALQKIGPYTLVRSLGQGSIGLTYLVEDPAVRSLFVLKVLWPNLSAHPQARPQLVQDATAVQSLRLANIAAVREVREAGSLCYVVSEYSPGSSLAQWRCRRPQPLAWDVAVALIAQLTETLDAAHRLGIVHGNLKPSNLFLIQTDEVTPANVHRAGVRIADFALAKAVQQTRLTAHGGVPWPMPQYLAPEQLQHRSRPTSAASDLYALGVLWYELMTGRCPVNGSTREEILSQTLEATPPSPRQYRPELPAAVEKLVLQCLHKNARERPASAKQLADALRGLLPGNAALPLKQAWWRRWLGM